MRVLNLRIPEDEHTNIPWHSSKECGLVVTFKPVIESTMSHNCLVCIIELTDFNKRSFLV